MKQQSWIIMSLVFALIISIFAIINVESVEVDFLFIKTNAPLILVILLSVLMGALLIVGFSFSKIFQLKREVKWLKVENDRLESANQSLKETEQREKEEQKQMNQLEEENPE
ncbi:LapA family protein [Piscibacillus salipiscarius]|uniref:Lipopolysaccharide assembly LapA domain-containing protein n=1 Tax=Piscibacillus salipiscarius TaxID=299480 RepID=A0ABW5Q7D8_9BACI|nr:lipopolysaccharide assembly protein LapA domain-containing protein [Piscibacillus salipiscarius]